VDYVRRNEIYAARDAIASIDEGQLEPDEKRFLHAVQAIVAIRTGDKKTAAARALDAFPTHAPDLDAALARVSLENAAHDGLRLAAIVARWQAHGIDPTDASHVARLMRYALVKLNRLDPATLDEDERETHLRLARSLSD